MTILARPCTFFLTLIFFIVNSAAAKDDVRVRYLRVKSDIRSRFATTLITSRLANSRDEAKEITFTAQLPEAAFISNFSMQIGDKVIIGDVKEKKEAKIAYEQAKKRGESAGLVAQTARETNTFTISANVAAHDKVTFNLTYQEILKRVHGAYKHIVNLQSDALDKSSIVEIYVRIMEQGKIVNISVPKFGPKIGEKTNAELRHADQDPAVSVSTVNAGLMATAEIVYKPKVNQMESANGTLAGQLVVLYDVERDHTAGQIQVVNGYFVHFFAPDGLQKGSKHVVFVLDKSGSMIGKKFKQTQEAMKRILSDLNPNDLFNIIMFATDYVRWKPESVQATPANVQHAIEYVMASRADYSTNLYDPLVDAMRILNGSNANPLASMIIFMTDGQPNAGTVWDSNSIVSGITALNQRTKYIMHGIAFGSDADFGLVQRISSKNNGLARKVYQDSDADIQLTGFYAEISTPLLTDVQIEYLNETVDVGSLVRDHTYNYYEGGELVIIGKLKQDAPELVTFDTRVNARGALGPLALRSRAQSFICPAQPIITEDDHVEPCCVFPRCRPSIQPITTPRPVPAPSTVGGFVERMWAYQTIKKLLKEAELGDRGNATEKRQEALKLSLKYHFVTEMTSMVVVQPNENGTVMEEVSPDIQAQHDRQVGVSIAYASNPYARSGGGHMMLSARRSMPMPGRIGLPPLPPLAAPTSWAITPPPQWNADILTIVVPSETEQLNLTRIHDAVQLAWASSTLHRLKMNVLLLSQNPNSNQTEFVWAGTLSWRSGVPDAVRIEEEVKTMLTNGTVLSTFQTIQNAVQQIGLETTQRRMLVWIGRETEEYKEVVEFLVKRKRYTTVP